MGHLPGKICHSRRDRVISFEGSRKLVEAIQELGNDQVTFEETPGDHTPFRSGHKGSEAVCAQYALNMKDLFARF